MSCGPVPRHIAVIMDGNGRWAAARRMPRSEGHRAGYENIRRVIEQFSRTGVRYVTLFAFSTENWDRPSEEVSGLLGLLQEVIRLETEALHKNGVRIRHIGRLDRLSRELQDQIHESVEKTRYNKGLTLCVAFDYGGRTDIVQAARRMALDGVPADQIDEKLFSCYLFTADIPDPDLIIRTGGEFRISNFLLWQSAYAEFHSSPVNWPDFGEKEVNAALEEYASRDRRFGRVHEA
ncbi:MAG: polyprenyl diphosphate synthase [Dehalococcoidia bacterium]